ncbi:MAG TPA: TetR/AcrR family transcriptional regulator [Streptosporangiaceae bacterium]
MNDNAERVNKNVERGQATRALLIDVATRLFASRGYDDTSIEMVLAESGVSRGSLYHHFPGKDALFQAVLEAVGLQVAEAGAAVLAGATDPLDVLRKGGRHWLQLASDPVVRQIVLIDAPAVLGWKRWRELDDANLGMIKSTLDHAASAGAFDQRHAEVFAHIVLAAANEVALMIALAEDPAAALAAAEPAFVNFLDRFLGGSGAGA